MQELVKAGLNQTKNNTHNMKEKNKLDMGKAQLKGEVGKNALWDGPLDTTGFPMGKGSSSGIKGMQVSKYPTSYKAMPITQIAKG